MVDYKEETCYIDNGDGTASFKKIPSYSITSYTIRNYYNGLPVTKILQQACSEAMLLTKIIIPNTVKTIEKEAFFRTGLLSVEIPENVENIENSAFSHSYFLKQVFIKSKFLTQIPEECFSQCSSLRDVFLDAPNVRVVEDAAFANCCSLRDLSFLEGITELKVSCFVKCLGLKKVVLPDNILSIGSHCFANTNITDVVLPKNLKSLELAAFNRTFHLKTICIPEKVKTFNTFYFNPDGSRKNIKVDSLNTTFYSKDGVLFNKKNRELILYPDTLNKDLYQTPENTKELGPSSFSYNKTLKTLILNDSISNIHAHAFAMSYLEKIVLPKNLRLLKQTAFSGCKFLSEIVLNSRLQNISNGTIIKELPQNKISLTIADGSIGAEYSKKNNVFMISSEKIVLIKDLINIIDFNTVTFETSPKIKKQVQKNSFEFFQSLDMCGITPRWMAQSQRFKTLSFSEFSQELNT